MKSGKQVKVEILLDGPLIVVKIKTVIIKNLVRRAVYVSLPAGLVSFGRSILTTECTTVLVLNINYAACTSFF